MASQNLEDKVADFYKNHPNIKPPYKSVGETRLAETFTKHGLNFAYEEQMLVDERWENGGKYKRLWYPDFYLPDEGVVVEYVGKKDPQTKKGTEHKQETYDRTGIKVVWIYGDDIFNKSKEEYERMLFEAIENAHVGKPSRIIKGQLETNMVEGHDYDKKAPNFFPAQSTPAPMVILKKIDVDLVKQFKEGLEDLKSGRVRRVA